MSVRTAGGVLRQACEILRQRIARNVAPNISDSNEQVPVGTIWRPAKEARLGPGGCPKSGCDFGTTAAEPAAGAQQPASGIVAAVVICPCLVPKHRVNNFGMQIGELARAAGVNIQTIRFYEREKLLPAPARTASGYRDYQQRDLDRILFIRRNHEIGFTLTEIRQLLDLHGALETMPRPLRRKPTQVKEIIAIGRERLCQVNEKICALETMKRQLEYLVSHLEKSAPTTCPVATQDAKIASQNSSRRKRAHAADCPANPKSPRR